MPAQFDIWISTTQEGKRLIERKLRQKSVGFGGNQRYVWVRWAGELGDFNIYCYPVGDFAPDFLDEYVASVVQLPISQVLKTLGE